MPARKTFSRWDLVWLLHPAGARGHNLRFVGRLGRKRPMWERLFGASRVVAVTALPPRSVCLSSSVFHRSHIRLGRHHRGKLIVIERRRVTGATLWFTGAHPPATTRPLPILRPLRKAPLDRIAMHISNLAHELIVIPDVAIKAATRLPEARRARGPADLEQDRCVQFLPSRENSNRCLQLD